MTSYKTILNIRLKSHMELFNCGIESALLKQPINTIYALSIPQLNDSMCDFGLRPSLHRAFDTRIKYYIRIKFVLNI